MQSLIPILKNRYLPLLFAIPLFFCTYRYQGIVVDAIHYVTQYVFSIDPARFAGDPSFDFGNQGSLGFFSPILGVFLELLGIATGAFVYTFLMQFAWVIAFVFFVKGLLRLSWQRLWALPVVILSVCIFSSDMPFSHIIFFHYLPSYACSRGLSIVLGLSGVALSFYQRRLLSLVFILGGTAVHPLTAGWCLPFWFFYFYPKTRIPVVIGSLLFPLSFLIHSVPFDTYPADWLSRPLSRPGYELLSLYAFLFIFFVLLVKCSLNKNIRSISCLMCLLILISFYWDMWSRFGEHILLYQVQPWRALWLPSLIAAPLGLCLAKGSFMKFIKKKLFTTRDFAWLLLLFSFFVAVHPFSVSFGAAILFGIKERPLTLKATVLMYGCVLFGGYLVQQYIPWFLRSPMTLFNLSILELFHARDSFSLYQIIFTIAFIVFFFKKRMYVVASLFAVSIFGARFMLLPMLPLFVCFFSKNKRRGYWCGLSFVITLIIFDGLIDTETRSWILTPGLPKSFFSACLAATLSFTVIYLSKYFPHKSIAAWLIVCCSFAAISYANYAKDVLEKDRQLDPFLHESIFSQIGERGRVFFDVSGRYRGNPRLQFMTGSYFDGIVQSGTVFYKGHYREALERSHLLYLKTRAPESTEFFQHPTILLKIADVDSLVDRVDFLCKEKEIHHLITDKAELPFVKEDSTMLENEQKVYLYACTNVVP